MKRINRSRFSLEFWYVWRVIVKRKTRRVCLCRDAQNALYPVSHSTRASQNHLLVCPKRAAKFIKSSTRHHPPTEYQSLWRTAFTYAHCSWPDGKFQIWLSCCVTLWYVIVDEIAELMYGRNYLEVSETAKYGMTIRSSSSYKSRIFSSTKRWMIVPERPQIWWGWNTLVDGRERER